MSTAITPEALYRDYHEKVERYISSHVSDLQDRADLKQQIFLDAIAALDSYDPSRAAPPAFAGGAAAQDDAEREGTRPAPPPLPSP